MVLRDRRTLVTSIVLPVLVIPLMLLGSTWTRQKREQTLERTSSRFAVTGSHRKPGAFDRGRAQPAARHRHEEARVPPFNFTEVPFRDPAALHLATSNW